MDDRTTLPESFTLLFSDSVPYNGHDIIRIISQVSNHRRSSFQINGFKIIMSEAVYLIFTQLVSADFFVVGTQGKQHTAVIHNGIVALKSHTVKKVGHELTSTL